MTSERPAQRHPRLFGVLFDEVDDAVDQGVRQPGRHRRLTPRQVDLAPGAGAAHLLGVGHHAFGGIGPAIEDDVLDVGEQRLGDVLVDHQLAGVDDAHVEPGLDGVEEEGRVDGLAHHVVAAEGERQVADAAADLHARTRRLDPARRLDEVDGVVVVFLEPGGDGQDVRVEDDVERVDAGRPGEQRVGPGADLDLALDRVGLARFVEGHHDHGGAVAAHRPGLAQEVGFAFLQADRVDDGLALHALEPGLEHRPLRAVDHDRQARDLRLGGDVVQEVGHARFRVEHALVHVDVEDVGPAADLLEGHVGGGRPVVGLHQPRELLRAGDVGAFADHLEVAVFAQHQPLEAAVAREAGVGGGGRCGRDARRQGGDGPGDGGDVRRRRAAAAADDVEEAAAGKLGQQCAGLVGLLVVFAEGVGQAGVRIAAHVAGGDPRQLGHVGPHLGRAEGAVDADAEWLHVLDRGVEGVDRLARERAAAAVGDGDRDHHRHAGAAGFELLGHGNQGGLGGERVEDGLDEQHVGAAVEQAADLVAVGQAQVVERGGAEGRIVDLGRQRQRLVGRPDGAGHEARAVRRSRRPLVGHPAGQPRALDIQLVGQILQAVVGLRDGGSREGVGLDEVGAGGEVLGVDVGDDVGPGQYQQVAVALEFDRVVGKARPPVVGGVELAPLDHGAHRAVQHEDAAGDEISERMCGHDRS